jgi:mono/diheme cytochrome c family protein
MDPSRDNPLRRFATFWWGLGTFMIFAVVLSLVWFLNRSDPASLEDAAAVPRYANRQKVDAAQAANISPENLEKAISATSQFLVSSKPTAVEKADQIVPGSPTQLKAAAAPAVNTAAIDVVGTDAPIDPAKLELGKAAFLICSACHGQNGEGGVIAPPLAGSEWVAGPVSNLIRIQLRGLQGAISVKGKEYNMPGGMAALSYQTDDQIANVLTYIRNSFGNKGSGVLPSQVAALRSEVGKPQVTVGELTKP